jgi:hypothetical protein
MYDNAGGKHVRKLIAGMRKRDKAEASLNGPHPGLATDRADWDKAVNAVGTLTAGNTVEGDPHLTLEGAKANVAGLRAAMEAKEKWAKQPRGEKSMDAIDDLERLAKGDVTQDLIAGSKMKAKYTGARLNNQMYGMMGKMSKKKRKVAADVMQYLVGKMSHGGDVTQKLIGKCNTKKSYFEPTLKKCMYAFQETPKNKIPDNLLPVYLIAFVEECYEAECREAEHKQNKPTGHREELDFFAKLIFSELVVTMGNNKEMARAAEGVTSETIASMLNNSGLIQPQVSGYVPTDSDNHEAMLRSKPFVGEELRKGHNPATLVEAPKAVGYVDDTSNPLQDLAQKQVAQRRNAYTPPETTVLVKGDGGCPIHGYGDLTKMMNLGHPYGKCSCS